jgi:hypothetical protein
MTTTGLYIVIGISVIVIAVFAYLIKTAPFGFEDKDGIHFFKRQDEMEKYMKEHQNES